MVDLSWSSALADPHTGEEAEQPEIETAKRIIRHYSKAFTPDKFPNPGEQKQSNIITLCGLKLMAPRRNLQL